MREIWPDTIAILRYLFKYFSEVGFMNVFIVGNNGSGQWEKLYFKTDILGFTFSVVYWRKSYEMLMKIEQNTQKLIYLDGNSKKAFRTDSELTTKFSRL